MAFETQRGAWGSTVAGVSQVDAGLRRYMLRVYNYMAAGLALTGAVAAFVASTPAVRELFFAVSPLTHRMGMTGLGWLAVLAPIGLVFALSFGINRMQASTAQLLFWIYAGLNGVSLSTIFLVYTGTSIASVFFITASSFLALSLYGYTTRRDLSAFGTFLVMGLFGLMIVGVVGMFVQSAALNLTFAALGVFIFAGLTAYDTQKIKNMYWQGAGADVASKTAIMGALALYLDFINMFIMLLRLFGDRRS
jgi:FtsH-binding integral membrane protein